MSLGVGWWRCKVCDSLVDGIIQEHCNAKNDGTASYGIFGDPSKGLIDPSRYKQDQKGDNK